MQLGFNFRFSSRAKIEAVTCEKVVKEVKRYFSRRRNRNYAFLIENLVKKNFYVIEKGEILEDMNEWRSRVKEKIWSRWQA